MKDNHDEKNTNNKIIEKISHNLFLKNIQKKNSFRNHFFSEKDKTNIKNWDNNIYNVNNINISKHFIYVKDFIKINKIHFEIIKIKEKYINFIQNEFNKVM